MNIDKLNSSSPLIEPCDQNQKINSSLEAVFWEMEEAQVKIVKKDSGEADCYCDLDSLTSDKRKLVLSFLGEVKEQKIQIDSGNDNLFHGSLVKTPLKVVDGDDRGRTFSIGATYELKGYEGDLTFDIGSTGFGQMIEVDGKRKDPSGRHYLNFREYNHAIIEYDKKVKVDQDKNNFYFISEIGFFNQTDKGQVTRAIQNSYHNYAKKI